MTHEPECLVLVCEKQGRQADAKMHEMYGSCYGCQCICEQLRQAYMRGYQDMCLRARHLIDKSEAELVHAVNKEPV